MKLERILFIVGKVILIAFLCKMYYSSIESDEKILQLEATKRELIENISLRDSLITQHSNMLRDDSLRIDSMLLELNDLETIEERYEKINKKNDEKISNTMRLSNDSSIIFFSEWIDSLNYKE